MKYNLYYKTGMFSESIFIQDDSFLFSNGEKETIIEFNLKKNVCSLLEIGYKNLIDNPKLKFYYFNKAQRDIINNSIPDKIDFEKLNYKNTFYIKTETKLNIFLDETLITIDEYGGKSSERFTKIALKNKLLNILKKQVKNYDISEYEKYIEKDLFNFFTDSYILEIEQKGKDNILGNGNKIRRNKIKDENMVEVIEIEKKESKHNLEFQKNIMLLDEYIVDLENVSFFKKAKTYFVVIVDGVSREINIDNETYILIKEKYISIKTNKENIL